MFWEKVLGLVTMAFLVHRRSAMLICIEPVGMGLRVGNRGHG